MARHRNRRVSSRSPRGTRKISAAERATASEHAASAPGASGALATGWGAVPRRDLPLLLLLCLALLAPFASKAFHIDDPLFLWAGQQIQREPLDFYGFSVNWYYKSIPMWETTQNPPLVSYYLAAVALLSGWHEVPLHLAMWLPAALLLWAVYRLADRFTAAPLLATVVFLLTPAMMVSATTLMCDVFMLALWCWALLWWLRGIDHQRHAALALAGFLAALAILTKYFAISLLPLMAVYGWSVHRLRKRWFWWLLVPLAATLAYDLATTALYGQPLFLSAMGYASDVGWRAGGSGQTVHPLDKMVLGLIFAGGCLITPALFGPWLWAPRSAFFWLLLVFLPVAALANTGELANHTLREDGHLRRDALLHIGLLALLGGQLLGLIVAELRAAPDRDTLLLFLWAAGTLVFATAINWSVNGRSMLPAAPALAMLLVRRLHRRGIFRAGFDSPTTLLTLAVPLALGLFVSLAATWADWRMANAAPKLVDQLSHDPDLAHQRLWSNGHWGFQYYMERAGFRTVDFARDVIQQGDLVVAPINGDAVPLPEVALEPVRTLAFPSGRWIATMSKVRGAGFYSDRHGPLPLYVGPVPPEQFTIGRARQNINFRVRE